MDTIITNSTLAGVANLSTQLPTVTTIGGFGVVIMIAIMCAIPICIHFLYKYEDKLKKYFAIFSDRFLYGIGTVTVCGVIYGGAMLLTDEGTSGAIYNIFIFGLVCVGGVIGVFLIGVITEPIWKYIERYVGEYNKGDSCAKAKKGA